MITQGDIEKAARALERENTSLYGWTDKQFETWFTRDPEFVHLITVHGDGFEGTCKQHLYHQVKIVLEAVGYRS